MALITCSGCGKKISNAADKCIHCGAPINSNSKTTKEIKKD